MNPLERALQRADRITQANKEMEAMSTTYTPGMPVHTIDGENGTITHVNGRFVTVQWECAGTLISDTLRHPLLQGHHHPSN